MKVKLPFLKEHSWPQKAKISGTSKYGFSEHDELAEAAISELLSAVEAGDKKLMMAALYALIEAIRNKNADHAHEDSEG